MSRDTGFGSATDFLQDPGKCLHPGSRPLCPMGSKYHPNPSFTQRPGLDPGGFSASKELRVTAAPKSQPGSASCSPALTLS